MIKDRLKLGNYEKTKMMIPGLGLDIKVRFRAGQRGLGKGLEVRVRVVGITMFYTLTLYHTALCWK